MTVISNRKKNPIKTIFTNPFGCRVCAWAFITSCVLGLQAVLNSSPGLEAVVFEKISSKQVVLIYWLPADCTTLIPPPPQFPILNHNCGPTSSVPRAFCVFICPPFWAAL